MNYDLSELQDTLDTIEGFRDDAETLAENVADINSLLSEEMDLIGTWTADLLDAQAYANMAKYAIDKAYSWLEDEL